MSPSQKSSTSQPPPLNRWKGRLRIFNKPTFWVSTAVLLLIGLLIADYSRVQMSQADIEEQLDLAREREEQEEGDLQDLSSSEYGDDSQPATLDGIPLPDDPELREWAIREANDLNPASELNDVNGASDSSQQNATNFDEDEQKETLELDEPARLITNSDDSSTSEEDDGSVDVNTRRNRRNRQDNSTEPLFSNYAKSADDVLSLMGLNTPRPQSNRSGGGSVTQSTALLANGPTGTALDLFSSPNADSLPPSALAQALQNLAIDSSIANSTTPLSNEATPGLSLQTTAPTTTSIPGQTSGQVLEGIPNFQPPLIQTAPLPGTTGYISPPPLPSVVSPGSAIAPTSGVPIAPAIGTASNGALGATVNSTTLAPQPTVTLPQSSAPQSLPTPVFVSPLPVEHTPYAGGGRNGEINTFSNP